MNPAARRRPADRDRAVARLRAITIGTGLAGVAAVGGFGSLAAMSFDGTSADGVTTAAVTTTTGAAATTAASGSGTSSTIGSTSSASTTGSSSSSSSGAPPPAATSGTAHAATGSS